MTLLFHHKKAPSVVVKWDLAFFVSVCRSNRTLVNMTGSGSGDAKTSWEWKIISNVNQISIKHICKFLWTITVKISHLSEQIWGNRTVVQTLLAQRNDANEASTTKLRHKIFILLLKSADCCNEHNKYTSELCCFALNIGFVHLLGLRSNLWEGHSNISSVPSDSFWHRFPQ